MTGAIIFLCVFSAFRLLQYKGQKDKLHRAYTISCPPPEVLPAEILMNGNTINLHKNDLHRILNKRFIYYNALEPDLKERFLKRLDIFIRKKIFVIKDDEGVKEMPVLISAAAISLTFGLKDFKLPFYKYIRIYPEEYIAEDAFKILAGNVQNNIITITWNHLLKGNSDFSDGSNVGLHEMSHALYIQKIVIEQGYSNKFFEKYKCLINQCSEAYNMEVEGKKDLYSNYANANLQEFWAESVELFFEKPIELKSHYPNVYEAMKLLLNQDTINKTTPILESSFSFKRLNKISKLLRIKIIRREQLN